MTALSGLKKWMIENDISVVDLNWKKLRKHGISMQKLLQWEMHSRRKKSKESRPTGRRKPPVQQLKHAICRWCGNKVPISKNGTLFFHNDSGEECSGSGDTLHAI